MMGEVPSIARMNSRSNSDVVIRRFLAVRRSALRSSLLIRMFSLWIRLALSLRLTVATATLYAARDEHVNRE